MVPTDQLQRIPGAGPGTVRHRGGEVRWGDPARAAGELAAGKLLGVVSLELCCSRHSQDHTPLGEHSCSSLVRMLRVPGE